MTLAEIVENLPNIDDILTIYIDKEVEPSPLSRATVVFVDPDENALPAEVVGMKYLLEVHLARDVLEVWQEWRDGRRPTTQEKCEAIIYYAENDAYLPV